MTEPDTPELVRLYRRSGDALTGLISAATTLHVGVWLGLLSRRLLHAVDAEYYSRTKDQKVQREQDYHSAAYNRRGLWNWEKRVVAEYFPGQGRMLVLGAGGGREVIALLKMGFRIDAYECHAGLVTVANALLAEEGYDVVVQVSARDVCPTAGEGYDGVIAGWGMYGLIQGRTRRVALLRDLRARTRIGQPLLLSFIVRPDARRLHHVVACSIANVLRRLVGHELAEVGDWISPTYVHVFTEDEIRNELSDAGFDMVQFSTHRYGHAIGRAV